MTSAAVTYRARLAEVRDLIRRIQGSLAIHERRQSARPDDWSWSGDLAHIAERLREITPSHMDRRCEWKHPTTCDEFAAYCMPDGRCIAPSTRPRADATPASASSWRADCRPTRIDRRTTVT